MGLYGDKIEALINAALADGELTEKEKQILFRKAEAEGIDLDEFEMVLDARLYETGKKREAEVAAELQAAAQQSAAPKSQKFGDIRKCPACGAIVTTGSATCVECGYAFNEDSGATAMDKLYERLDAIEQRHAKVSKTTIDRMLGAQPEMDKAKEKLQAIRMFNVPNTRAELLGLLTSLQPLANPDGSKYGVGKMNISIEDLSRGYWDLFVNCINKARISFANDKAFEPFFKFYEEKTAPKKKGGLFSSIFGKK